jgi:molybdopterin converting factor small subunit
MAVQVRLTYEMSKALGSDRFEVESAETVADVVRQAEARFGDATDPKASFETLSARAAIAVNGVLVRHARGLRTPLHDGDTVTFVKAAAGG